LISDSDDVYLERLASLENHVDVSDNVSKDTRDLVLRLIGQLKDMQVQYPERLDEFIPGFLETTLNGATNTRLARLPSLLAAGDDIPIQVWARELFGVVKIYTQVWSNKRVGEDTETPPQAERRIYFQSVHDAAEKEELRIARISETSQFEADRSRLLAKAESLVETAEGTAKKVKDAAGISGNASLSIHFKKYAFWELVSANVFRVLTIAAIGGAISAAIWLEHPNRDDWPEVLYRIAIVLGIAALGAYFGRQAGQHRRVYNWAKAVQVQLQSFPAFIETVTDEDTQATVFATFARRVLGAPPEKAATQDQNSPVSASQVIELMAALAKRSG
jgi:hypothetical protein